MTRLRTVLLGLAQALPEIMPDVLTMGGLGLLGYGLYLRAPWLGYAVPGALLFAVGLLASLRGGSRGDS